MVRTRVRLAATLAVVVFALTGFHSGKGGHGSGGGSGSGKSKSGKSRSHSSSSDSSDSSDDDDSGGGCSSSEKDNDDYGSNDATATPSPLPTATGSAVEVVVVDCVKPARKKGKGRLARGADTTATLEITSHTGVEKTYRVTLEFKGAGGNAVDSAEALVTVGAHEEKTFEVAMEHPKTVDRVRDCWVYDVRER
ncbi:hypothetical protein [Streptomyces sp. WAC08241]|uniref:hypothetical protein n=1 Tax=Streptomyces sp. WAC08241 TaxID=2487421 RepID=UPI000F77AE84|nr:hypothetical protein [Streptomyces sp. WAC08241]RSS39022.1 hypothetical protein EF906_19815 [Streptomyces sp. WAC08241]